MRNEEPWSASLAEDGSGGGPGSLEPAMASRNGLTRRRIEPEDWLRYRESMAEIFTAFGMNVDTPGTERTPERFLNAMGRFVEHDEVGELLQTFDRLASLARFRWQKAVEKEMWVGIAARRQRHSDAAGQPHRAFPDRADHRR